MQERSRTIYTVLGMLALGSMSGYEIIKTIRTSTNHFWSESDGQIYPALARCVKEGFATCKEETAKNSKRSKKIYSVTAKGKKALTAWLKKEVQTTLVRNELLLKLFFGRNTDNKDNIHHVMHYQKTVENEISTYEHMRRQLTADYKDSVHLTYWLITLDYGIKAARAELAWCKETLKSLNSN